MIWRLFLMTRAFEMKGEFFSRSEFVFCWMQNFGIALKLAFSGKKKNE